MRTPAEIFVVIFIFNFSLLPSYAMTQSELIGILNTADTKDSSLYSFQIGMANLDKLEGILLLPAGNPIARHAAFTCLSKATHDGLFPSDRFFNILFNQINNLTFYSGPELASSDLPMLSNLVIYFSYFPQDGSGSTVEGNFNNLVIILNSLLNSGFFRNQGIENSLESKIKNSLAALLIKEVKKMRPKTF